MIWHGWIVYKILYSHMQYTLYILCVWDCRWSTYAIVKIQCSWLFTMVFRRGSQFVPGNSCTRLNRNRAIIKEKKNEKRKRDPRSVRLRGHDFAVLRTGGKSIKRPSLNGKHFRFPTTVWHIIHVYIYNNGRYTYTHTQTYTYI